LDSLGWGGFGRPNPLFWTLKGALEGFPRIIWNFLKGRNLLGARNLRLWRTGKEG